MFSHTIPLNDVENQNWIASWNTHQNAIWLICASISDWQKVHMQKVEQ